MILTDYSPFAQQQESQSDSSDLVSASNLSVIPPLCSHLLSTSLLSLTTFHQLSTSPPLPCPPLLSSPLLSSLFLSSPLLSSPPLLSSSFLSSLHLSCPIPLSSLAPVAPVLAGGHHTNHTSPHEANPPRTLQPALSARPIRSSHWPAFLQSNSPIDCFACMSASVFFAVVALCSRPAR